MKNNNIKKLISSLESCNFRFSNYQDIPPFIFKIIPELDTIKYKKKQIDLDIKRYEWLKMNLPKQISKICEVGSNMGYFSFSLANEFDVRVDSYESNKSYTVACEMLSKLINLDKNLKFYNKSVDLKSIDLINSHDLAINLNVLHHAGVFFDKILVKNFRDWTNYVISYLKKLGEKSEYLFFQTGNMREGEAIFSSDDTISLLTMIFDKSGWVVEKIGVIDDLKNLNYETYNQGETNSIKLFKCRRDKNNMVGYYKNGKLINHLLTGLAQRPLWLCKKK